MSPSPDGFPNPSDYAANELKFQLDRNWGPDHDPAKPPIKRRGDGYVIVGSLLGLVAGGALGYLVGLWLDRLLLAVPVIVIGGIVGALLGDRTRKRMLKRSVENPSRGRQAP